MHCILAALAAVLLAAPAWAQAVPQSRAEISLSFAPIVREAAPAVVNIHATRRQTQSPLAGDPMLRHFFRGRATPADAPLGSGVIVDPSGLVVTNAHVINGAADIRVSLNDRREYPATLLLRDDRTDLAVLRIESETSFPTLPLGDADHLQVGDLVLAIGNPFGVGQTVTQGIVSALARTQVGVTDYRFFIQTDAAINPGNSGGALIDMSGRLIGINTAIYSRTGTSSGIGFAIPADMVGIVVDSAREGRTVRRPWLGARLQSVDRDIAEAIGLDRPSGALVVEVVDGGPADAADLRPNDVIISLDGMEVADRDTLGYLFATRGIGGDVELEVLRRGAPHAVTVALEGPPEDPPRDARRIDGRSPFTGIIAMNLSPAVADELNLDLSVTGVAIARVDPRSHAQRVGLRPRDRILEVNGIAVEDTATLERLAARRTSYWDIIIDRDGQQLSLVLGG